MIARAFENGGFGPSDNSSHEAGIFNGALFCEKQVQIDLQVGWRFKPVIGFCISAYGLVAFLKIAAF